ncbi:hypothetical protein MKZ38_005006 [Zalerion maritima]|uniref:Uncharacterized protein n=1 Tax=Zalerion maritima TaxID=339359 RepID=A0AAD5RKV8_9PEZI|nr:hypothetical protein MKZ38_005006 [Zalerion maritima]
MSISDTQKDNVVQQETVDIPQKQNRFKRHCARFWWIHLIVFIIIAVLVVVLVIFVAVPKIAQKKLDDAELTIEGIQVSNAIEDSMTMSINSTIYADDSIHATIEGFRGDMYLEDLEGHEPFASVDFPETTTASVQTVNITQNTAITNPDALATFNTWLIMNDTVRITVKGDTKVHVKGLSKAYGVTFKKTLEMKGMKNFETIKVTYGTISVLPDDNGDNFKGFVNIPNQSIFSIDLVSSASRKPSAEAALRLVAPSPSIPAAIICAKLTRCTSGLQGNATMKTVFEDEEIGVTYLDNLNLVPGDNNITMHSSIDQLPILQANNEEPYCEGADFPFYLTGINVTRNGENLTYFGEGMSRTTQLTEIPIGDILERDLNITASCGSD